MIRADDSKAKSGNINRRAGDASHERREEIVPDLFASSEEAARAADEKDRVLVIEGCELTGVRRVECFVKSAQFFCQFFDYARA